MTQKNIPTSDRLAIALQEVDAPLWMVERARKGEYDDFKSPHAMPLHKLMEDVAANGLPESFKKRIVEGEFDCTLEEGQAWMESEEGQEVQRRLMRGE